MIDKVLLDLLFQLSKDCINDRGYDAEPLWAAKGGDGDYFLAASVSNRHDLNCVLVDIFAKGTHVSVYTTKKLEEHQLIDPSNPTFDNFIGKLRHEPKNIIWAA